MSEYWINNKLTKMTKEEAVLKLIDVHAFLCRYSNPHDKWTDAVNIGIEAIKRVIEVEDGNDLAVEDCVSRAEVLKLMKDNWHTHNGDWAMQESMDDIRALPSVTLQAPNTGHWTDDGYCSCCNKQTLPLDISGYASGYDSFCPNCGAKMVEP